MIRSDFVFSVDELRAWLKQQDIRNPAIALGDDHSFRLMIPKYYLGLIDWADGDDSLSKMVITSSLENDIHRYEVADPIADKPHSPVPGIVHRHRDRCLLMLTNMCAVHCRFCFRKNMLSENKADLSASMNYIASHSQIWEVILSGGDPFMFTDHFLTQIIDRLNAIKHVKVIRFHTRVPAVYPARLTDSMTRILARIPSLTVVIHINHVREITPEFVCALDKLSKAGAMLLSQSVLLKGVNDSPQALSQLFCRLVEAGVKPYYLHHLDAAAGTHYFRMSLETGKKIVAMLRERVSGTAIPTYVIDLPGGHGKYPVDMFQRRGANTYSLTTPTKTHIYTDHA